jgi:hypothetical protein
MNPFAGDAELRQQIEQNRAQFVMAEVDLATTFCAVAQSSDDPEKVKRNVGNARTGYDTILKFWDGVLFDAKSRREFEQKFSHLKSLLKDLGEDV